MGKYLDFAASNWDKIGVIGFVALLAFTGGALLSESRAYFSDDRQAQADWEAADREEAARSSAQLDQVIADIRRIDDLYYLLGEHAGTHHHD